MLPQATADRLLAYVQNGGHLFLGARSGMKNQYDGLNPQQQPGPLAEALGARVTQFYALDSAVPVTMGESPGTAQLWAETLRVTAPEARVLATYGASNGWLDGQPAAVTRSIGKGSITYLGASLDAASLRRLVTTFLAESGVAPILPHTPEGVEVCVRTGKRSVLILLNHTAAPVTVALPLSLQARSLLSDEHVSASNVALAPHGVSVLQVSLQLPERPRAEVPQK